MKSAAVLFALLVVAILAGCSGTDVTTDFNREWNLSPYKTYDWVAAKSPTLRDPLLETSFLDSRVKNAVEREFGIKGYSKLEEDPDFLISYHIGSQSQVDVSTCGYHYPTSPHCWGGKNPQQSGGEDAQGLPSQVAVSLRSRANVDHQTRAAPPRREHLEQGE